MMKHITLLALLAHHASAMPAAQVPFIGDEVNAAFNPLKHMSGIAPYNDAPGASIIPPKGCSVTAAAFLIRHSCIYANDDEYYDFMLPFIQKVASAVERNPAGIDAASPLSFLSTWESPVREEDLEALTEPGRQDAFDLGKRFRVLYKQLLPPKRLGKGKPRKGDKVKAPFKVFSASSGRDVGTARAWLQGAFPHWQEGEHGEGDGKFVSLVKVPNDDPDWAGSLTPHKICPAFTKEAGKPEAREWLETFAPAPLARLQAMAPDVGFELNDVIAMFMLCGYESVILKERKSRFCSSTIFEPHEFHEFAYWNDLKYHYQVGYGSPVAPYLGVGWLNASTHNLLAAYEKPHPHLASLPPPTSPPDTEHTQLLFPYFTHREEPPVALVALGLWNTTNLSSTSMDHGRLWKTSHLLPFLGHVALERINCPAKGQDVRTTDARYRPEDDFIRVIVNGAVQELESCRKGPGRSCPMDEFGRFVAERVERYKDFEGACKVDK